MTRIRTRSGISGGLWRGEDKTGKEGEAGVWGYTSMQPDAVQSPPRLAINRPVIPGRVLSIISMLIVLVFFLTSPMPAQERTVKEFHGVAPGRTTEADLRDNAKLELISGTLAAAYRQARIRLFAIDLATIKNPRSLSSKQSPGGGWRFEGGLDEQRMTCTVGPLEYDQANRWQKQTLDKVLALGKLAMLAGAGAGGAFGEAFQGFGGSF